MFPKISHRTGRLFGPVFLLALSSFPAFAASTAATGIDASFSTMLTDLTGMLGGNFGALVLLVSLIIAVGVYAVTSNVRYVVASLMVAFMIGYGVDIVQGIGGVTATTDMIAGLDTSFTTIVVEPTPVSAPSASALPL